MTWVAWRQHRSQVYRAAAALAVFAVLLLVTGRQMASQYQSARTSCDASHTCGNLAVNTLLSVPPVLFLLVTLTVVVPCLLGVFWGGPLVARELETGTSRFTWMQSITRSRWLTVTAGWALLAAAAWSGAVSALVTWWSSPVNALKHQNFQPGQFDIQGIVPVGYALFAVALGIAAGTLLRRTLPATAITQHGYATFGRHGRFYKFGLVVRPGATVTVTIRASARGHAVIALAVNGSDLSVTSVTYHACRKAGGFYPEGFAFTRPPFRGCVPLDVTIGGQAWVRHITLSLFAGPCTA